MNTEMSPIESYFAAPAIAIGALCGIAAVLIFFPLIDRLIRPRFQLERGSALLLLLLVGLIFALGGSLISYFTLRKNAEEEIPAVETSNQSILDDWSVIGEI